jgi:hypothetical protein
MSQSGLGKPDSDLVGVELLFHQKGGSASFGAKTLNAVDLSCMNSITPSTCRAKCSNILHDGLLGPSKKTKFCEYSFPTTFTNVCQSKLNPI